MDDQPTASQEPPQRDTTRTPHATGGGVHAPPPSQLGVARIALFINAVLITLEAVAAYQTSVAQFDDPARALGAATFTELFAVLSVVLGLRLPGGRRGTRVWTNVVATLTLLLLGLGRASQGDPLGLLVALVSIAVLVFVNTADVRRFFQQQAGDARGTPPPHAG